MHVHVFGSAGLDEGSDARSNSCLSTWKFTNIIIAIIHKPPIKPPLGNHAFAIELADLLTSRVDMTVMCLCWWLVSNSQPTSPPRIASATCLCLGHLLADTDQVSAYVKETRIDTAKSECFRKNEGGVRAFAELG